LLNLPKQLKDKMIKDFKKFENGVNDESVIHHRREQTRGKKVY
jgi:hypothetical protein